MGSGLSSDHRRSTSSQLRQPPARVIGADGSLREFPASATCCVSDVLGGGGGGNDDRNAGAFFVCSADALYFDAEAPALGADELLRPGQLYFVLPAAMRARPLSAADMAALAVRATEALAAAAARPRGGFGFGMRKARVGPEHAKTSGGYSDDGEVNEKLNERTLGPGVQYSTPAARSARKLTAAKAPPPMVKRALSAIQEVGE